MSDNADRPWSADPLRVGVVGLGMGRSRSAKIQNTPGVRLCAVCDRKEDLARETGEERGVPHYADLADMIRKEDLEAVFVITQTGCHAEPAIQALEAGMHVIVTKPMEASLARADLMLEAARKSGKFLLIDFEQRFRPDVAQLRHAVADGFFGRRLFASAALFTQRTKEYFTHNGGWRGTFRYDGGGVFSNQAVHQIDELLYCLGHPKRVRAQVWTTFHEIEGEDLGNAIWEYDDGLVLQFNATTTYTQPTWYPRIEIHGTEGAFSSFAGGPHEKQVRWFAKGEWSDTAPNQAPPPAFNSVDNLAAVLRQGATPVTPAESGRATQAVLEAMYRSARDHNGDWVEPASL